MLIRVEYTKTRAGRFLSHLDLMRAWERAIRRSGLPLAFSQGFNPHPKLSFGSALAVGTTSDGEYLDMELTADCTEEDVLMRLKAALPPALTMNGLKAIAPKSVALMSVINRAQYVVTIELAETISQEQVDHAIENFLAQDEVTVLRFKKNSKEKRAVNIRQGVFDMSGAVVEDKLVKLFLLVQTGSEGNVRPEEAVYGLSANGLPIVQDIQYIHRKGLYIATGDGLKTPLVD